MPIYEYSCKHCNKLTEIICKVSECKQKIRCECGRIAVKILNLNGAVHPDGDVKWLESARLTLQPDGEIPITTRGEYKRYLRDHNVICKG
jgi:putative FmdB family regulatory protein